MSKTKTKLPEPEMQKVTDGWLDHAIQARAVAVVALGADRELLSALVELRDWRRARSSPGRGEP